MILGAFLVGFALGGLAMLAYVERAYAASLDVLVEQSHARDRQLADFMQQTSAKLHEVEPKATAAEQP